MKFEYSKPAQEQTVEQSEFSDLSHYAAAVLAENDKLKAENTALKGNAEPPFKIYKDEVCYKSTEDDQTFGMWVPVSYDMGHAFPEGTGFYPHPAQPELASEKCDVLDALRYKYVRATTTAIHNAETGEKESCTPEEFDAAVDLGLKDTAPQPTQPDPIAAELLAALKEIHKNIGGDWASNEQINRAAYVCKQAIKRAEEKLK